MQRVCEQDLFLKYVVVLALGHDEMIDSIYAIFSRSSQAIYPGKRGSRDKIMINHVSVLEKVTLIFSNYDS